MGRKQLTWEYNIKKAEASQHKFSFSLFSLSCSPFSLVSEVTEKLLCLHDTHCLDIKAEQMKFLISWLPPRCSIQDNYF